MMSRNDSCWCGSGQKWKKCHFPAQPPVNFNTLKAEYKKRYHVLLKTEEEITGIRHACKVAATILEELCLAAKEGVTTLFLDKLSRELHKKMHATAPTLGYGSPPYPASICTSLNDVICHGFPDERPLQEGDILNIDVASLVNGYYGDNSKMVCIGKLTEEKERVVQAAHDCLMEAIKILKPGLPLFEIGNIIEKVAYKNHCSVVYQFVGHGCGLAFHEEPQIHHNYNKNQMPLAEGMIFTIEPMINAGLPEAVIDIKDGWTARTIDGKPSAQWEHQVLITKHGHEILTTLN